MGSAVPADRARRRRTPAPREERRRPRVPRRAGAAGAGAAGAAGGAGARRGAAGGGAGAGGGGGGGGAARRRLPRRRSGLLLRDLRRSDSAGHDLVGEHEPRVEPRRRQDVVRRAEPGRACTSTSTTSGPIRRTRTTSWSATTAARTSRGTKARRGGTSTTCRSRSSIASRSTTRCRSTTCAAARRTTSRSAARRARSTASASALSDWYMIGGGDGFQSRIDPGDPNIVYATLQSGGIARLDLRTGENKQHPARRRERRCRDPNDPAGAGGAALRRWRRRGAGGGGGRARRRRRRASTNWDAPYIISPHLADAALLGQQRACIAATIAATHWTPISPDLTRNLDPRVIPIMGKVWDPDDDRRLQQRDDAAQHHRVDRRIAAARRADLRRHRRRLPAGDRGRRQDVAQDDKFAERAGRDRTSRRAARRRAMRTSCSSTLNNWQRGDFKPYVVRSDDRGKTFKSIAGDLPDRHRRRGRSCRIT